MEEDEGTRWIWCLAREDGPAELRLPGLLGDLARDADSRAPIEVCAPRVDLLETVESVVARREALLRAARLAPLPVRLDAPQRQLWGRVQQWIERGELRMSATEVGRLRQGLLRPLPRGSERRLEELCAVSLTAERTLAQIRRVVGEVPRWSPQVRLRIVAGLQLD